MIDPWTFMLLVACFPLGYRWLWAVSQGPEPPFRTEDDVHL